MKLKNRKERFHEVETANKQKLSATLVELCEEYLKDFPKHIVVWLYYGDALISLAQYRKARIVFSKAIKLLPTEHVSSGYVRMGRLYDRKGDYYKAIEWYQKAFEAEPEEASYPIFLGVILLRMGNLKEAEHILQQATKCKEGHIDEAFYNLGVALASQRKYEEALSCFEKALQIDPKYKLAKHGIKDMTKVIST